MKLRLYCLILSSVFSLGEAGEEIRVAEGLAVRKAVLDGLVESPIVATLDDRGRLFVVESRGTNLSRAEHLRQKPGYIRLLEDTDGDGVFDRSKVFADGLTYPRGALWIYDSLYVMSPPSLWRLIDSDGDGRAEKREELVTGFDFAGNAAKVHGPFLHPNGRLFWSHGREKFSIPDPDTGEILHRGKGARIWSSTLSGGSVEPFAGGGMDNPVELDFTKRGEILGTANHFYAPPKGDALVHWVQGGAYPRRDQPVALRGLSQTGPLLEEIHNFGRAGISGMCRYRSGALDLEWTDQWLVAQLNTARITRIRTNREGASFASANTEIIFESKDPDAHFTDVLEDENGDLLVLDAGGKFQEGTSASSVANPQEKGTIYRILREGFAYASPSRPLWNRLTAEQVSAYLDSDFPHFQDRAILELADRGDPSIPELRRLLQDPASSVRERRNAIWTLSKMRFAESSDLIYDALVDPAPSVRQAAANAISVTRAWQSIAANQPAEREIELERNRTISGALARIVRADEPPVAREAAVALGRMAETRAMGAIFGRIGRVEEDRFLRHSLIFALIEMGDVDLTRQALESENPRLVSAGLQALDQMDTDSIEVLDILPYLDSPSELLRETVLEISTRHTTWDAALANRFFAWQDEMTDTRRNTINRLMPKFADAPPMHPIISLYLENRQEKQAEALHWLGQSDFGEIDPAWIPSLKRIIDSGPASPLFEQALDVLHRQDGKLLLDSLDQWIENDSTSSLLQSRMLRLKNRNSPPLSGKPFDLLLDTLESETDSATRIECLEILTKNPLTVAEKTRLAQFAPRLSYPELVSLMKIFRKIESAEQAETLSLALSQSSGFLRFDPDWLRQLFRPFGGASLERIDTRIEQAEKESESRAKRLEEHINAIAKADPARGKELFFAGVGNCIVCHRVNNQGGQVGPDLSQIGVLRGPEDLLESILYPDVSIARGFETVQVIEKGPDRNSRVGIIERSDTDLVTLVDAAARKTTIRRSRIDAILPQDHSLMPSNLKKEFDEKSLPDLVAFLLELGEWSRESDNE